MKFSIVAQYFEKIEKTPGRLDMTEYLCQLFKQATPEEAKIISYFSLGEMHPPYVGAQFQVADKMLLKVFARILSKSEEEVKELFQVLGDIGLVIDHRAQSVDTGLSVHEVYVKLDEIEKISGQGAQEKKIAAICALMENLDNLSAKFVSRILVGKLRLGFSDMTLIDALSWMLVGDKSVRKLIENAYNTSADIGLIAYVAKDKGVAGLEDLTIQVGIPIRPAAAERMPTAKEIFEKLGTGIVAQPKLDGFRLQIHVSNVAPEPFVKFFSRNLVDMSHMFPDLVEAFKNLKVETLICEGEAIVYDVHTGNFVPFQETVKRRRKHDIEEIAQELPLKVFIFDILYLDGKSLMALPHTKRREIVEHVFKHSHKEVVSVIDEVVIHSIKQLEDYFYANIEAGLEGLVVKKPDSIYQPGKRNFNWVKLKREEAGLLEDTIDCVVLGYYYGEGKRTQLGIGGFLAGVYDKKHDNFHAITKVGTGLTDEQWVELKNKCDAIKAPEQPKNVECAKDVYPDVWVYPEIVVLIRADEITRSPRYTAGRMSDELGYALRFPRFMGYREDKSAFDATEVEEIKHMYKDQKNIKK